jgi:hypothetical protein
MIPELEELKKVSTHNSNEKECSFLKSIFCGDLDRFLYIAI